MSGSNMRALDLLGVRQYYIKDANFLLASHSHSLNST